MNLPNLDLLPTSEEMEVLKAQVKRLQEIDAVRDIDAKILELSSLHAPNFDTDGDYRVFAEMIDKRISELHKLRQQSTKQG